MWDGRRDMWTQKQECLSTLNLNNICITFLFFCHHWQPLKSFLCLLEFGFFPLVWIFWDRSFQSIYLLISIIPVRLHIWSKEPNTTPWYNDPAQHLNINTGQMTFQPKEWGGVDDIWQCGLQLGKLTQGRSRLYIIQSNFTVGNI